MVIKTRAVWWNKILPWAGCIKISAILNQIIFLLSHHHIRWNELLVIISVRWRNSTNSCEIKIIRYFRIFPLYAAQRDTMQLNTCNTKYTKLQQLYQTPFLSLVWWSWYKTYFIEQERFNYHSLSFWYKMSINMFCEYDVNNILVIKGSVLWLLTVYIVCSKSVRQNNNQQTLWW